jgi:HK97 family phage portal protein
MGTGISVVSDYVVAEAMAVNIAIYRCVNVISGEIGAIPWNIINVETNEIIDSSNENNHLHPLADAIDKQWRDSGQPFFYLWSASLLLSGKTFIEPVESILGRNYVGVNWLNPINVTIEAPQGIITGYTYNTQHGIVSFDKRQIVYDRFFNPNDDNSGLSPAHLALRNAKIDYRSKQALLAFYVNGALPYAIVTAKDMEANSKVYAKEWEQLRNMLQENYKGAANQYRVLVHGLPVDVNTFELPDLEKHTRYLDSLRNEIYIAFGLAPPNVGDTSGTPYKADPQTYKAFFTQVVEPITMRITQAINNSLLWYFDRSGNMRFEFDTTKYDALTKNSVEEDNLAKSRFQSGVITIQTYRKMIEDEMPVDEEEQRIWDELPPMVIDPSRNILVPLEELPNLWKTSLQLPQMEVIGDMLPSGTEEETKGEDELFPMLGGYRVKERPIDEIIEEGNAKAKAELKQWLQFRRNKTKGQFVFYNTRPSVELYIREELEKGSQNFDIYTNACKIHSMKAIENVKARYIAIVSEIIKSGRNKEITQKRFRDLYRGEHKRFIAETFSSGLEDAGIFDPPTEDEIAQIEELQTKDTPFIREFAKVLYSEEGISDAQAAQKPQQWWSSVTPAYSAGLTAGGDNGMYEWSGTDGKNTCVTCQWLDGPPAHKHRKNIWERNNLDLTGGAFAGQGTKCKGFQCLHTLIRSAGKAQGGALSRAPQ